MPRDPESEKWSRFITGVLQAGRWGAEPDHAHPALINSINKKNRRQAGNVERTGKERRLAERILQGLVSVFLPHHSQPAPGFRHSGFRSFPSVQWEDSESAAGERHTGLLTGIKMCVYTFLCVYTSLIYFFGKAHFENIYTEKSLCSPYLPHSSYYPHGLLLVTTFISFSYILPIFPYTYIYIFLSLFKKVSLHIYIYTARVTDRQATAFSLNNFRAFHISIQRNST